MLVRWAGLGQSHLAEEQTLAALPSISATTERDDRNVKDLRLKFTFPEVFSAKGPPNTQLATLPRGVKE